jgi:hypothetical protein
MFPESRSAYVMAAKSKHLPKSPVARHRARLRDRGLLRVEVHASKDDAPLLRAVAAALADPLRAGPARMLLRTRIMAQPATSLKALLEAAPLEGVDLERALDFGRPVEF